MRANSSCPSVRQRPRKVGARGVRRMGRAQAEEESKEKMARREKAARRALRKEVGAAKHLEESPPGRAKEPAIEGLRIKRFQEVAPRRQR